MGKKTGFVNTKVEAANARKESVKTKKDANKSREMEAIEAAEWEKGGNARAEKRRAEERKRQEQDAKKAELKQIQALEEHAMAKNEDKLAQRKYKTKEKKDLNSPWEEALQSAGKKNNKGTKKAGTASSMNNGKTTLFQIQQTLEEEDMNKVRIPGKKEIQFDTTFQENRNRQEGIADARNIEDAIDALSLGDKKDLDRHPEKRAKAAYKAFEETTLPELKEDFPGLKLSQYKKKLSEMWRRSPQNPLNQEGLAYNAKKA